MPATSWILLAYVALAFYDAGMSWVLQLMHYPLYHQVGSAEFSTYVRSNNRRAFVPAILPALATLGVSLLMIWRRPHIVSTAIALTAVLLNLIVLLSTAIWQGRLHSQLVHVGKSDAMISQLVRTNWIRTVAFTVQAVLAAWIVMRVIEAS